MKWSLWISLLPASACIIGTILNSLVMGIYSKDWCKKKALNVCDQILLSMAFTSTDLQWVITLTSITFYLQTYMVVPGEVFFCIFVVAFFLIEVTFWQMALLSMYYCVKLLNVSFTFFRWVKRLIMGSTIQLLLISAAFCLAINVPFVWAICIDIPQNVTEGTKETYYSFNMNVKYGLINMMFGCCLPFAITFTCIVLSVGSVIKHVWKIRSNVLQFSSSRQLGGHIRAASTMVLCVVFDLSFCLTVSGLLSTSFSSGVVADSIHWAVVSLYPTTRSIILTIGNPQLRRRMVEMCASSS